MAEFLRSTGLIKLRRAHEGTATSEYRNEGKGIDLLWEYETDPVSFINIYKVIKNKKGGGEEWKYTSTNEAHQNTVTKACILKNLGGREDQL